MRPPTALALAAAAAAAAAAPPNIALIVADDIPRNMLGAYGAAHGLTPHLDGLAREGIAYESAYAAAPLCTPSRFSLLTGRYASNASSIASHRPWNLVGFNMFLTGAEPTVAHLLRSAGYRTALVGSAGRWPDVQAEVRIRDTRVSEHLCG